MTGRCHAYIIEQDGEYKVRPAIASVDRLGLEAADGEPSFIVRNLTSHEVTLSFGEVRPVPPEWGARGLDATIPPGTVKAIPILRDASGFFAYGVTVGPSHLTGPVVKARGESGPGMIIDP